MLNIVFFCANQYRNYSTWYIQLDRDRTEKDRQRTLSDQGRTILTCRNEGATPFVRVCRFQMHSPLVTINKFTFMYQYGIMLLFHNHENVSYANLICINALNILIKRITENKINI